MLNYSAMKNHLKLIYIAPVLLALLLVGCSSSTDEASNQNAPQSANKNTAPPVAQTAPPTNPTPSITPTPAVPAPPQLTPPAASSAQNANKAAAAPPTSKPAAGAAGTPKLTVLTKDKGLDFGKQPQDKSLVRGIQIKNSGTAELKIETVAPG